MELFNGIVFASFSIHVVVVFAVFAFSRHKNLYRMRPDGVLSPAMMFVPLDRCDDMLMLPTISSFYVVLAVALS